MAPETGRPVSVTFLFWKPGEKPQKNAPRFRHAATVNHRKRKAERAGRTVQALKVEHVTEGRHHKLFKQFLLERQFVFHPEKSFAACLDPFNALSTRNIPAHEQAVLQFAIVHQWPCFAFSSHKSAIEKWLSQIMTLAMGNSHLLHAILYAGTSYQLFLGCQDQALRPLRMTSYQESLVSLRQTVSHPNATISNALLLSITILALLGSAERPVRVASSTDPMYRDNEFYTGGGWEPAHVNILLSLTKQKGGIKSIEVHDVAEIIGGIDTHDSMCRLRKPYFAPLIPTNKLIHCFRGYWDAVTLKKFPTIENVFEFLPNSKPVRALSDVVSKTRALFATYDMMLNKPELGIDIVRWVVTRRAIQNEAMSIDDTGDCLFKTCRLAVQMFIAESIEPWAHLSLYHENSSRALLLAIDECDRFNYWEAHPDVLLWATIIGGYTARENPIRWWYAEQTRHSPIPLREDCWTEVQKLSENFLPFKYRQGDGLQHFWNEACSWISANKLPRV